MGSGCLHHTLCIHPSAILVVSLPTSSYKLLQAPTSCDDFAARRLTTVWMSWSIFGSSSQFTRRSTTTMHTTHDNALDTLSAVWGMRLVTFLSSSVLCTVPDDFLLWLSTPSQLRVCPCMSLCESVWERESVLVSNGTAANFFVSSEVYRAKFFIERSLKFDIPGGFKACTRWSSIMAECI